MSLPEAGRPVFVTYKCERMRWNIVPELLLVLFEVIWITLRSMFVWILPSKPKNLQGEIVFITGGAGALGRELGRRFLLRGCSVVLVDVNEKELDRTHRELSGQGDYHVAMYVCNVADRHQLAATCRRVEREVGHPTILVNNAAIVGGGKLLDVTDEQIRRTFEVNSLAPCWAMREFLPRMLANNHGYVINIISILARDSLVGLPAYCASKSALDGLVSSARREIAVSGKDGVGFTSVFPYVINTPLFGGIRLRFRDMPFCKVLEVEDVAAKTIDAMDRKQIELYLPKLMYFMIVMKNILPERAYIRIHEFCGSTDSAEYLNGDKFNNGKL